jgi:hypothetical protein
MKALTQKNLIELLPTYSDHVETALLSLADTLGAWGTVEAMRYGLAEGFVQCVNLEIEGEASYVIFFSFDPLTKSIQFSAAALTQKENWALLMSGLDSIAQKFGAKWIHFNTRRAGVVKRSAEFGYRADTINLVKELR